MTLCAAAARGRAGPAWRWRPRRARARTSSSRSRSRRRPPATSSAGARSSASRRGRSGCVAERARHEEFRPTAYTKGPGRWQVSWFDDGREVAQVKVDDAHRRRRSRRGPATRWRGRWRGDTRARSGARSNAPYVWIPLCLLFLAPFFDPRRPFRMVHLDLLMLLGFGVSHIYFNRGEIGTSVPLAYPFLAYLLAAHALARRAPARAAGQAAAAHPRELARRAADRPGGLPGRPERDRLERDRCRLRGCARSRPHRRRQGAVRRRALLGRRRARRHVRPGELSRVRPVRAGAAVERLVGRPAGGAWRGARVRPVHPARPARPRPAPEGRARRDGSSGSRSRSPGPPSPTPCSRSRRTATTRSSRSQPWRRCSPSRWRPARAGASAAWRGLAIGLGAAAKFAPLALAPLFATAGFEPRRARLRSAAIFAAVLALVGAATFLPFLPDGGLREIYDRTLGYQAVAAVAVQRLGPLRGHRVAAHRRRRRRPSRWRVAVAFVPRRRDVVQVAALAAAVADRLRADGRALVLPLHRLVRAARAGRASSRGRSRPPGLRRGAPPAQAAAPEPVAA